MSFFILGIYFAILVAVLLADIKKSFIALVLGTLLFPCCALFVESPAISGQIVFLYAFLLREFLIDGKTFREALFSGPLKLFLFFIVLSYAFTTIFNFSTQNAYYAVRDILDVYGYLLASMIAARKLSWEYVAHKLYWVVFFFCCYGLLEAATNTNLLYKYINMSFPAYDGWYNLNGNISASESWRIRTIITTKHPTALGTLLTTLFLFYVVAYKKDLFPKTKILTLLGLLGVNMIFSGSRTSVFCTMIAMLYLFMKNAKPMVKIICVALAVYSSSYIAGLVVEKYMDNKDGSSIMLRLNQLAYSVQKIRESPVWGNGSNYTAHQIKDEGVRFNDDDEFIGGLESVLFIYMIDRGLLGVFSFYLFWAYFFWYLRKKNKKDKNFIAQIIPLGVILFLSISGLIGNNTGYCMIFLGLFVSNSEDEPKQLESELPIEV